VAGAREADGAETDGPDGTAPYLQFGIQKRLLQRSVQNASVRPETAVDVIACAGRRIAHLRVRSGGAVGKMMGAGLHRGREWDTVCLASDIERLSSSHSALTDLKPKLLARALP
jgi:hypothetical protein